MLLSKIKCCSVDLKACVHTVIHPNKSLQEKHEVAPFVRERTIIKCALLGQESWPQGHMMFIFALYRIMDRNEQ